MGLTATAQAAPAGRSLVLTGKAGEPPLIYVAPGVVTMIRLDARIVPESVQLEGRARFAVVEEGEQSVTVSPTVALGPGERLALRVTYREGSPASVVFLLTGQPGTVDGLVNVSRPQQTFEACRVELSGLAPIWWLSRTLCGCPPGASASPLPKREGTNLSDNRVAQNRYGAATERGGPRCWQSE
ncbi:uncharacterized protein STAUR_7366 [Stigmatella aurantiaca DW4/3-1]|uniref:Myxococcus xanthus paralogous family TIGR02268 n=1 Tax=Stigmatella aurantiaca (strain DW4/3-1) TaxID=378806 RepID=E3FEG6_STIAD|nr:uncharacterized protein STAUR_7366 [Stigmatella aurantiaca DW4/3-1]